ncbi:Calmodulin-related protein [Durusdinium trenchii]|uniref:Calmodulin-related protein n=1 Tax=Durusdinium trenchii TaxID=1381693 RepID=A0ABP0IH32_9DINO
MGAGASTEGQEKLRHAFVDEALKPLDASDIKTPRGVSSVEEVKRLRALINEYGKQSEVMIKALLGDVPSVGKYFEMLFGKWDKDGNGTLSSEEFWSLMDSLKLNLAPKEIAALQRLTDGDGNGSISLQEFVQAAPSYLKQAAEEATESLPENDWLQLEDEKGNTYYYNKRTEESRWTAPEAFVKQVDATAAAEEKKMSPDLVAYLTNAFKQADADESGNLDLAEFEKLLQTDLKLGLTEEKYSQLVHKADVNGDGAIKWQEFVLVAPGILQQLLEETDEAACWVEDVDSDGTSYFFNTKTGVSQWDRPAALAATVDKDQAPESAANE